MQEVKSYSKTLSFLPRKITLSLNNTATSTRRIFIASISKTIKNNKESTDQLVAPTCVIEQQQQRQQVFPAFAIAPKKVSFSPMVKVKDTSYYTPEEKEATFYNSDDYQDFKQDIKSTLQMINARMVIDETNFTRKGTESYMPNGEELRKTWRTKGRHAVFNAQRRLYFDDEEEEEKETESNNNTNDEVINNNNNRSRRCCCDGEEEDFSKVIAAAYAPTGIKSAQLAYVTGLMDERMVKMADLTAASSEEEENNNINVNKELNPTTSIDAKRTDILLLQQQSCQQQRLHQPRRNRQRRRQLLHSGVVISPTAA